MSIRHRGRLPAFASLLSLLAACSEPPARPSDAPRPHVQVAAPTPADAPSASQGAQTTGGDGSPILLGALRPTDVAEAGLHGELGCSFEAAADLALLVASGDVASDQPAQGVVKLGDSVERVFAPGGFDAMLDGAVFTGKGKTVRIAIVGRPIGGGESPPRAAVLTYLRADGAQRRFDGRWTCGP